MKRNLLMLLFAMLMGVFCVNAQKTITIDVDNAASVNATDGVYGTPISLHDGINSVELSNNPLSIQAAPGASITSVTCDGLPINANGAGMYNIGVVEGMQVKIITSGAAASSVEVMFAINNPESATVTSDGVTTPITNYANIGLKLGEYAVIAPVEGYVIESCQGFFIDDWKQNEVGSVSFMPAQYCYI
ncbi:MAG: hypothetical protein K2K97_05615, partial [Muribaculaceae bacterium]|nr:hypothetical protein [Muribaculaceae bacterium]